MEKDNKRSFALLGISFALFAVLALVTRYTRYCWNNIPAMVIPDVLISVCSAGIGVWLLRKKKTAAQVIAGIAGFLFPNVFLWGLIMPLQSVTPTKGVAAVVGFVSMFAFYAVLSAVLFFAKKDGEYKKKYYAAGAVVTAVLICGAALSVMPLKYKDTEEKYDAAVADTDIFENSFEQAYPQTQVYSIITKHLSSPPKEGTTVKKCAVIGFDGTRADIVKEYTDHRKSGIKTVLDMGGHAYLSYCGGVQWPETNTQATSTAPGWCSMLTGSWANVHGIYENYIPKTLEFKSLFLSLIESGRAESTMFCVSWDGHFNKEDSTYYPEKVYAEENDLNVAFLDAFGDSGTYDNVIKAVKSDDCPDFLFCIFEQCDHTGHQTDFGPDNFGYRNAFKNDDSFAFDIIKQITRRETYETEDWLIIITSDHGGFGSSHGGASKQERYTFIITNTAVGN